MATSMWQQTEEMAKKHDQGGSLWLKLAGEQTTGSAMPQGSPLSAGDLGTIQNWIEEGAP